MKIPTIHFCFADSHLKTGKGTRPGAVSIFFVVFEFLKVLIVSGPYIKCMWQKVKLQYKSVDVSQDTKETSTEPQKSRRRSVWNLVLRCFSEVQEKKLECNLSNPQQSPESVESDERIRRWLNQSQKNLLEIPIPLDASLPTLDPAAAKEVKSEEMIRCEPKTKKKSKESKSPGKDRGPTEKAFGAGLEFLGTPLVDTTSPVREQTKTASPEPTAADSDLAKDQSSSLLTTPWFNFGPIICSQGRK